MSPTKIFLTGSTGYIGGSVLTRLLKSPEKYSISALVRNKDQGEELKKLGVVPIYGSLDDTELIFKASKEADAVVDTASADHLSSAQAMIKGLKAKNNKKAVFFHTSGTGVLTFDPVTKVPFDDEDIQRIHSIPQKAPHKEIDQWIFDNVEDITAAIIAPSTIYGLGTGPFKKTSIQVIAVAKASAARRKAGYVGDRKDVLWGNVNIHDLVDLYILILEGLLSGTIDHGKKGGWYFGSSGEHSWSKVGEVLGQVLHKRGLVDTTEISPFEKKYSDEFLYGEEAAMHIFGHDSRAVANRSKRIGWKPKGKPTVYESIDEEVQFLIKNGEIPSKSK
jgi:nucleoside-diphosphate-sugar epimerase